MREGGLADGWTLVSHVVYLKKGFLVEILADGQATLPVNRKRLAGELALLSWSERAWGRTSGRMDACFTYRLSEKGFLVEILADGQAILPVNKKRPAGDRALLSWSERASGWTCGWMHACFACRFSENGFLVELLAAGQAILPVNRKRLAGERALLSWSDRGWGRTCGWMDACFTGRLSDS